MSRGAKVLYCVYLTLLMGFTGFVTLDTFVIARVETTLEAPQTTQTPSVASAEPIVTENSYQDAHISIQIDTRRLDDTTVYIADVTLSSPEYLKTALAQNAYGKNVTETTSAIARGKAPSWLLTAIIMAPANAAMCCATARCIAVPPRLIRRIW